MDCYFLRALCVILDRRLKTHDEICIATSHLNSIQCTAHEVDAATEAFPAVHCARSRTSVGVQHGRRRHEMCSLFVPLSSWHARGAAVWRYRATPPSRVSEINRRPTAPLSRDRCIVAASTTDTDHLAPVSRWTAD